MRILVVNDDGIRSPGIEVLARAALPFGKVWVVAPDTQCSGMSQKLTIFEEMPLRRVLFPVGTEGAWSLGGTPADCVKIALDHLPDLRPDFVFSGVNDGWNAGFDVVYSGTVGACCEAVMNGIPAIAFSCRGGGDFSVAERFLPALIEELTALPREPGVVWNVNFPGGSPDEVRGILRERRIAPMQFYNGVYSAREHPEGHHMVSQKGVPVARGAVPDDCDIAAVLDGWISVGRYRCPVL